MPAANSTTSRKAKSPRIRRGHDADRALPIHLSPVSTSFPCQSMETFSFASIQTRAAVLNRSFSKLDNGSSPDEERSAASWSRRTRATNRPPNSSPASAPPAATPARRLPNAPEKQRLVPNDYDIRDRRLNRDVGHSRWPDWGRSRAVSQWRQHCNWFSHGGACCSSASQS